MDNIQDMQKDVAKRKQKQHTSSLYLLSNLRNLKGNDYFCSPPL